MACRVLQKSLNLWLTFNNRGYRLSHREIAEPGRGWPPGQQGRPGWEAPPSSFCTNVLLILLPDRFPESSHMSGLPESKGTSRESGRKRGSMEKMQDGKGPCTHRSKLPLSHLCVARSRSTQHRGAGPGRISQPSWGPSPKVGGPDAPHPCHPFPAMP